MIMSFSGLWYRHRLCTPGVLQSLLGRHLWGSRSRHSPPHRTETSGICKWVSLSPKHPVTNALIPQLTQETVKQAPPHCIEMKGSN